ncbi:MAG TPA: lysylphosphatidylglycerol synthase transmembrane domain-containing protein [Candidatus Binatia bacterium]|nr:lysylphosphatidylglycerol synthase transmembrane domain-containing protein [Candidatus Binatia bacterium]
MRSLGRWAVWALVFAVVGWIAWRHRDAVARSTELMTDAHPLWLLLAVASVALVYLCRARVYGIPLQLLDYTVPWTFLWQAAIIASAANQLVPTGGASSYAFLTWALHKRGVSMGQAPLIALIDTLSYAFAAATLVIAALVYLAVSGLLGDLWLLTGFGPGALLLMLAIWVYWLQRRPERLVPRVLALHRRLADWLGRDWPEAPVRTFLEEYYKGKEVIGRRPAAFLKMIGLQYLAVAADAGALYLTFVSLDLILRPALVLLGFVVTLAAGAFINAPAGGGSFEVVMSAFFARHGLETPQAVAGALLFRLVSFWAPVAVSGVLILQFRERRIEIRRRFRRRRPR